MSDGDAWCGFLERALWGLRRAAENLHTPKGRENYHGKKGYWRKPNKFGSFGIVRIPNENAVTEALIREFEILSSNQFLLGLTEGEMDIRHLHISAEKYRRIDPAIGDSSNPTDFALELRDGIIFQLRIEAKTISVESEITSGYLNNGLRRFDDAEKPYTIEKFGAMIAYVITEDEPTWEERVGKIVTDHVGGEMMGTITLLGRRFNTSRHWVTPLAPEYAEFEVQVVHFVFPVEADPKLN